MANETVRNFAKEYGVRMWQIAEAMGVHENTLTRKLRHELPEIEQARIMSIILQISGEEAKENE